MLTVVHASDIHFGKPFRAEAAEAFVAATHQVAPDAVVISGDFTQRAKMAEFQEAAAFLERLPAVPRVVVPGNHDVPLYRIVERLVAPHRNYRQHIADELDTVVRIAGATFVALDSTEPRTAIVNGRIRQRQIEFARAAFAASPPGDLRVVVAHHHFAPAPDYEGDRSMPGARRALQAFVDMGVEVILGGHLHRAYIGNSLDVFAGGDRDRGLVIVQSGTTTSRRGRAREQTKNSFNVMRVDHNGLEITHHMYFDNGSSGEAGGFAPVSEHRFPRRPHRWLQASADEPAAS